MLSNLWDVIVVGGGLAGSVISSRLYQNNNSLKILLIEAGEDVSNNTFIPHAANNQALLFPTPWNWNDTTVPQGHLNNRVIPNPAGKGLGGGTIINSCGWIRGDRKDFDEWGHLVGALKWSYDGQLPYLRKMEHSLNTKANPAQHGFEGPIWAASVSSTGRKYPLRDKIKSAWSEAGVEMVTNGDINDGSPLGLGELQENRKDGLRQVASSAYDLTGVTVLTNTLVGKVLISRDPISGKPTAKGVILADGTEIRGKEVVLTAGAYRTPQLLMLSGIGPADELKKFNINKVVDAQAVGKGLADHMLFRQLWKLRPEVAESGVALGSGNPLFTQTEFGKGVPTDWLVTESLPTNELRKAIKEDEGPEPGYFHPLMNNKRSFIETLVIYAGASPADPIVPFDGSHIATTIVGLLPTSKGTITLRSTNPADHPVIDPQYFSTKVDRLAFRHGVRRIAEVMLGTEAGKSIIARETPQNGFLSIERNSSDYNIESRIRQGAGSTHHPMGTAAMGKVVDNNLNVNGVAKLRVADTSVFPVVITAHIQQAAYALAEQAAVIIGHDFEREQGKSKVHDEL